MTPYKIGLIGCGNIAPAYMRGCGLFPDDVQVTACADIDMRRAEAFAAEYDISAYSVDDMLSSDNVDIAVNLTVPMVHAAVSMQVLNAGKHVYSEKPLAAGLDEARELIATAKSKNLRIGCAPDTFLGAGLQTSRAVIDDNKLGQVVAATAFLAGRGPGSWHPNPFFFYQPGGGPMLDMGPYYVTALIHLFGPVKSVAAFVSIGEVQRVAGNEVIAGQPIPVDTPMHYAGTLQFVSGTIVTMMISWEVYQHGLPHIEVFGTQGSMRVPDPNTFGGPVSIWTPQNGAWQDVPLRGRDDLYRGIGVVDMARSMKTGRPHRASGALAVHALEVMCAFEQSSMTGQHIAIEAVVDQPPPFDV